MVRFISVPKNLVISTTGIRDARIAVVCVKIIIKKKLSIPFNLEIEGEDEKLSEKEVCEKLINIIGIYKEYISSSTNINEILSISADIKKEYDLFLQKYSKQIDTILTGKNRKLRELKNRIGTSVNSLVKFAEKKAEMIKNGGN